jgi:hypothetical protein
VEGAHLGTSRKNVSNHRVDVLKNVARCNSDDPKSFTSEDCIASRVTPRLVAETVGVAINFNNQPVAQAREVDRDLPEGKLPSELPSLGPFRRTCQSSTSGKLICRRNEHARFTCLIGTLRMRGAPPPFGCTEWSPPPLRGPPPRSGEDYYGGTAC